MKITSISPRSCFRTLPVLVLGVFTFLLSACGASDDTKYIQPTPPALSDISLTFYEDKPYVKSNEGRRTFDLLVPQCVGLCPVVVFIHGGKFTSGDKSQAYEIPEGASSSRWVTATRALLEQGIAVATVNYTYLNIQGNEDVGLKRQMTEITRAVQQIKHDGMSMGILAHKIMLAGHSAGAGAAFWLAFSDDQKKSDGDDVDQTSTVVRGVFALDGQSTYDIIRWNDDVMPGGNVVNDILYGNSLEEVRVILEAAYDLDSLHEWSDLSGQEVTPYRRSLDMLALLTPNDPPFWIDNSSVSGTYATKKTKDLLFHSGEHAEALHKRALEVGVQHTAISASDGTVRYYYGEKTPRDSNPIEFAVRILSAD